MSGLGIFLCPIAAIMACDYWLVKRRNIDVPALYKRNGRYRYNVGGTNWRSAIAFLVSSVPNIPGMAQTVNSSLKVGGAIKIYNFFYIYGFSSAVFVYWGLNLIFPAEKTIIPATVYEDIVVLDSVEYKNDGVHTPIKVIDEEKNIPADVTAL